LFITRWRGLPTAAMVAVTPRPPAGAASLPGRAATRQRMVVVIVGLGVAARLARDPRTHAAVIVAVIAVAALAGMGRDSRAQSFARLAAWDKRRSANH
jgi:hypothetical protein